MSTLRVVPEAPPQRHFLIHGLPEVEELQRWAAQSVDTTLDLAARQMAAQMLSDAATKAVERLTAVAMAAEMATSFVAAKERVR